MLFKHILGVLTRRSLNILKEKGARTIDGSRYIRVSVNGDLYNVATIKSKVLIYRFYAFVDFILVKNVYVLHLRR